MPRNQRKRTHLSTSRPPNREQRRDQARRAGFFGLPLTQVKPNGKLVETHIAVGRFGLGSRWAPSFNVHQRTPFAKRFPAVNTPYVKAV